MARDRPEGLNAAGSQLTEEQGGLRFLEEVQMHTPILQILNRRIQTTYQTIYAQGKKKNPLFLEGFPLRVETRGVYLPLQTNGLGPMFCEIRL